MLAFLVLQGKWRSGDESQKILHQDCPRKIQTPVLGHGQGM